MANALGLMGVAVTIGALALLGPGTSLWWPRVLMFALGLAMGQVFVPLQAAAFATITPAATGKASTMFNALRQLGKPAELAIYTELQHESISSETIRDDMLRRILTFFDYYVKQEPVKTRVQ